MKNDLSITPAEPKVSKIRLSSSSPAILEVRNFSNHNLNSLADAFANCEEKENIYERPSSVLETNDQLRR